mmetsp:Transcript_42791/g.111459  ORF Transcript_42791/g.111459 Transcript_42791/m.111459 type:complete len:419 (-) Transcript_42791:353-1609(-)
MPKGQEWQETLRAVHVRQIGEVGTRSEEARSRFIDGGGDREVLRAGHRPGHHYVEARHRLQRQVPAKRRDWQEPVRVLEAARQAAQPELVVRHHGQLRDHGHPGARLGPERPARSPRQDDLLLLEGGGAPDGRRLRHHRGPGRPHDGRAAADHDADAGGHPCPGARGPLRQHSPRQLLHHCGQDRLEACWAERLRAHGGRLRVGHGRGEVLQHQVLLQRPQAELRRDRLHRARPEAAQLRGAQDRRGASALQGVHRGERRARREGLCQSRRTHQQRQEARGRGGRGDQCLPHGHAGGASGDHKDREGGWRLRCRGRRALGQGGRRSHPAREGGHGRLQVGQVQFQAPVRRQERAHQGEVHEDREGGLRRGQRNILREGRGRHCQVRAGPGHPQPARLHVEDAVLSVGRPQEARGSQGL